MVLSRKSELEKRMSTNIFRSINARRSPKYLLTQKTLSSFLISLLSHNGSNTSAIARDTDTTNSSAYDIIKILEGLELIITKKDGRQRLIFLTPEGKRIASILLEVQEYCVSATKKLAKKKGVKVEL